MSADQGVVRRRVKVHGRVQGVWFRDSCRNEAQRLGVSGFARNCPDGTVDAAFEGAEAGVERMVAWCHHGPRRAEVIRVEVHEEAPDGTTGFRVA